MKPLSAFLILSLALSLEACTTPGSYPSLARRDVERVTGMADPIAGASTVPQIVPPSADLQGRVEQLLGQARGAHAKFAAQRDAARRAVAAARGSASASESWVTAQTALGALEAARSAALTALSEIDQLYARERVAVPETVSPSAALLGSARDQVKTWVDEENDVIGQLTHQLAN